MVTKYFSGFYIILGLTVALENSPQTETRAVKCDFGQNADAFSAYERAKTVECKQRIESLACYFQSQAFRDASFTRTCMYANNNKQKRDLYSRGCLKQADFQAYISSETEVYNANRTSNETTFSVQLAQVRNLQACIDTCLTQAHLKYAAFDLTDNGDCVCLRYLKTGLKENLASKIEGLCKQSDQRFYHIYHTGLIDIKRNNEIYEMTRSQSALRDEFQNRRDKLPRIVFMLTLNGRTLRQVFRLFKSIYNEHHYYYFHVDQRMVYLRGEIARFLQRTNKSNIFMPAWSMPTMWGGANLLDMHLSAMKELMDMKREDKWSWDFVLNLSESDFPIK